MENPEFSNRSDDPNQPSEDDEDQENTDDQSFTVSGPYMHIFLDNFRKDVQNSVNKGKISFKKKNRRCNDDDDDQKGNGRTELVKHEPPANPLPADNLKSCMKNSNKKKGIANKARKVTWALDVYDYTESGNNLSNASDGRKDDYKSKNKKSGGNTASDYSSNKNDKDKMENKKMMKKGQKGDDKGKIKGDKGKDKKWEKGECSKGKDKKHAKNGRISKNN